MFEDSLLESGGTLARRNPWTTAFSFAVQLAVAGVLVLFSMLYTDVLPVRTLLSSLEAPPSPPSAPPLQETRTATTTRQTSELNNGVLMTPQRIPDRVLPGQDEPGDARGSSALCIACISVALPGTGNDAEISRMLEGAAVAPPRPAAPPKVRVSSGVAQGMLIRQVRPQYPPLARQARIQGTVVLQAVIGKDGSVQELHVMSGHPLLAAAAIDAVRQWLYRPYLLNGDPVSVDTQINVNFTLASE